MSAEVNDAHNKEAANVAPPYKPTELSVCVVSADRGAVVVG